MSIAQVFHSRNKRKTGSERPSCATAILNPQTCWVEWADEPFHQIFMRAGAQSRAPFCQLAQIAPASHSLCPIRQCRMHHQPQWFEIAGPQHILEVSITSLCHPPHAQGSLSVVVRDVTKRKKDAQRIRQLAYYDALTGLGNRNLLEQRLPRILDEAHERRMQVALFFIDLDCFKNINDNYGHDFGDQVLRSIGRRLRNGLPETLLAIRLGGDEFLLATLLRDTSSTPQMTEQIHQKIQEPIRIEQRIVALSASVGLGVFPQNGENVKDLIRYADQLMYKNKRCRPIRDSRPLRPQGLRFFCCRRIRLFIQELCSKRRLWP